LHLLVGDSFGFWKDSQRITAKGMICEYVELKKFVRAQEFVPSIGQHLRDGALPKKSPLEESGHRLGLRRIAAAEFSPAF
jgi:hypothetical protein